MTEPIQPTPDDATLPGRADVPRPAAADDATLASASPRVSPPPRIVEPSGRERYAVGCEVARGGMGSILRATDLSIDRTVAMKIALKEAAADEETLRRFTQEAKLTGQLEHPNIVPVHDLAFDEQNQPFYTMKFVQGVTLHEILSNLKNGDSATVAQYSLAHLLTIFQKVCDAVAFAHSNGVIHRDLKPANIMVGGYGEVLVMDWGLAKVVGGQRVDSGQGAVDGGQQAQVSGLQSQVYPPEAAPQATRVSSLESPISNLQSLSADRQDPNSNSGLTLDGQIMGSPQYMAPEQAEGEIDKLDARTDIFALGGVLYNILTLHPPVSGKSVEEMLEQIRTGTILPPTSYNPKTGKKTAGTVKVGDKSFPQPPLIPLRHCPGGRIPESLGAVAMQALALKQEDRYQSVPELQKDIEAYQGGFATGAEKASAWRQAVLLVKRHKKEFALAAVALGIIVTLVVGFVVKVTKEKNRAEVEKQNAQTERNRAEAEKQHAQTERDRAEKALTDLQGTAPTFYRQAQGFIKEREMAKALEMIAYAIQLVPDNADYRALQGNILQTMLRLGAARDAYRQALDRKPGQVLAAENLKLCEKLLRDNSGQTELKLDSLNELQAAMRGQGRFDEAVVILQPLDTNRQRLADAWTDVLKKAGWNCNRPQIDPQGILSLELTYAKACNAIDLSPIKGMPLTKLVVGLEKVADLTPLKGMPLRELSISGHLINNLEPLRGMPLESLTILEGTTVSNLSPLAGLRLKHLKLYCQQVTDLSPLKGMPLETLLLNSQNVADFSALKGLPLTNLAIFSLTLFDSSMRVLEGMPLETLNLSGIVRITDLSVLKGMPLQELRLGPNITNLTVLRNLPLKRLDLTACQALKDFTPLKGCQELEVLAIPATTNNIEFLRDLPKLKRLGKGVSNPPFDIVPLATEFWKAYDAQKTNATAVKPPNP